MSVAAPSDRRFKRAHARPARRRRLGDRTWFRLLRTITALTVVGTAAVWLVQAVVTADTLRVGHFTVEGNERLSAGEIVGVLESLRGESLLLVDLDEARERLLGSPWVRDAAVRRVLPSTIEISVVERLPLGLGRIDGRLYLVDRDGLVIDEFGPQYSDLDLPVIDGLSAPSESGGLMVDPERARLAAALMESVSTDPEIAKRVSQIDVADVHDAVVLLSGDGAALHLGSSGFVERIRSYIELQEALRERVSIIDYVDLRFDGRVYVRPAQGATVRRAGETPPEPDGGRPLE